MAHETIDGVPIWFEERGDPDGPPLVALHGGIMTFEGSFGVCDHGRDRVADARLVPRHDLVAHSTFARFGRA